MLPTQIKSDPGYKVEKKEKTLWVGLIRKDILCKTAICQARRQTKGQYGSRSQGLPIPFSSKKVKTKWLRKVATALEVPEAAAVANLRLMIEGKLEEMDHQSINVQVMFDSGEGTGTPSK